MKRKAQKGMVHMDKGAESKGKEALKGCVHIYWGDGKGKTTAALGLALRAAGRGKQVVIARFLKTEDSGEVFLLRQVPGIRLLPCAKSFGFTFQMDEKIRQEAALFYGGLFSQAVREAKGADLLILDVMMPGLDGIRTTLKVRENSSIPIIILSAKSEDADKILGLNIGADDYITKPFNPLELMARVKSQLRRYTQLGNMTQQAMGQVYKCGGLQINDDNKEVLVDGEPIKLTPIEYNILLLLVKNAGKVFSIDEIYEQIWNEEAIGADNTVAVHIRHIREKIEINPREPRYLKVVWGVGYKIEKQ